MIELPDKKKCFNLNEQVAQNLRNITYLAEQYKNIDALPAVWQVYKEEFDSEIETFEGWTTTFEGWDNTLSTYLANMSSAAVSAIAGQNIAPANITSSGNITANSIIQNMTGFSVDKTTLPTGVHIDYAGIVQNGNKLTFVQAGHIEASGQAAGAFSLWGFNIPSDIGQKLYPLGDTTNIDVRNITLFKEGAITNSQQPYAYMTKGANTYLRMGIFTTSALDATGTYHFRYEVTFLLSDNLAL